MEHLELTGTCPLIRYTGNNEYQLPTQKQKEHLYKSTAAQFNGRLKNSKSKNNLKITDKLLKLYNTPTERETLFTRTLPNIVSNIAGENTRSYEEKSYAQKMLSFPMLKNNYNFTKSKQTLLLQHSKDIFNECLKQRGQQCVDVKTTDGNDSSCQVNDRSCVALKVLDIIRPSHPEFAKEININPEGSLKINSIIPGQRLNQQLSHDSYPTEHVHRNTFPNILENSRANFTRANKASPNYWWKYLDEKISKKVLTPLPCLHKNCKLCELKSEHSEIVNQNEQDTKDTLHIDLKRLTEVRSRNWSTYGHFTRIHKLKYTKRQKNLLKCEEKRVEVDEDYLSVDVDKLMNIYERKSIPDGLKSVTADKYDVHTQQDANISSDNLRTGCTLTCVKDEDRLTSVKSQSKSCFQASESDAPLERPATTKLRSCINFTSRKTSFTTAQ